MQGRSPLAAADELRALLAEYDRANRLEIDSVYAQFSPTLDDFYAEDLHIVFPEPPPAGTSPDEVRPEIILTRTVPGQQPKSVRALGTPFPLRHAAHIARSALATTKSGAAPVALAALDAGAEQLWPVQLPKTQLVQLRLLPSGDDLLAMLAGTSASTG